MVFSTLLVCANKEAHYLPFEILTENNSKLNLSKGNKSYLVSLFLPTFYIRCDPTVNISTVLCFRAIDMKDNKESNK